MDKELVIRNTIILFATALTFIISQLFLGPANIILCIVVFLIALFILNKDFTGSPLRVFVKIMSLNLLIGIAPYIANMNVFLGFFINFIVIFSMLYLLVYRLKKSIYFPFLLNYTLLLCSNPTWHFFVLRMYALIIIGIILFLVQIFINRKKQAKSKNNNLFSLLKATYEITDNIVYNTSEDLVSNFDKISKEWTNIIFETRTNNFYLNKTEDIQLNIISTLEKLKTDIIKLKKTHEELDLEFIYKLKTSISNLIKFAKGDINIAKLNALVPEKNCLLNDNEANFIRYEIEESIIIIKHLILELKIQETSKINIKMAKQEALEFIRVLKSHFTKDSVRFTFAFKTALIISITYFIIQFFEIPHGSWIIYTIGSVSQPYNDTLNKRGLHRIKGTVLGAIYFLVLFYIFRKTYQHYLILMFAIYMNSFMKSYDKQITYITLLVLGLVSLGEPTHGAILSFDRIYLVIIGVIITLVGGRLIFPYYISKETKVMLDDYHNIGEDVVDKLLNITKFENNKLEIQNQTLLAKSIENKIIINNSALDNDNVKILLAKERYLLLKAQAIINRVEYADVSLQDNRDERIENLNKMRCNLKCLDKEGYIEDTIPTCLESYFKNINKTSEWLIYRDILEMFIIAKNCTDLKNEIIN